MGTNRPPSDPAHQAVREAGRERRQKQEIEHLRDELREHVLDEMAKHDKVEGSVKSLDANNSSEHTHLRDMIHGIRVDFASAVERLEGKLNSHRIAAIVAWAIIITLGGLLLDAHVEKLTDVAETVKATASMVAEIDKRQESWEKFATGWGNKLEESDIDLEREHERDIDDIRRDLKQLQRGRHAEE